MHNWYLAYCKAREEARAEAHLKNQGVEAYYPMVEIEKIRRGKRVKVREPMFPNYLFIYADLEQVLPVSIRSTRGIARIIQFGSEWTKISPRLIYQLMSQDDSDEAREMFATLPQSGDKVVIASGPFQGLEAIYQEPDGDQRAILLLNLINQQTRASFGNSEFRPL